MKNRHTFFWVLAILAILQPLTASAAHIELPLDAKISVTGYNAQDSDVLTYKYVVKTLSDSQVGGEVSGQNNIIDLSLFPLLSSTTYKLEYQASDGINPPSTNHRKFTTEGNESRFIAEYDTSLSSGTTVTLALFGSVSATIDWDASNTGVDTSSCVSTVSSANFYSCTYPSEGVYQVAINGTMTHFGKEWSDTANIDKLVRIIDFGETGLTDLSSAFRGAVNLVSVPLDLPSLSQVTNLNQVFFNASTFNSDISSWNVSQVTSFRSAFQGASSFNSPLTSWDTSSLTEMRYMFRDATSFNQPINHFDTSGATNFLSLFESATSFNQPLDNWDTSNVTEMSSAFRYASSFNQNIGAWNVSNVVSMQSMFQFASLFNQDLLWTTTSLTNMQGTFQSALAFNGDISGWDTSSVNSLRFTFRDNPSFNGNLSSWNTGMVTTFEGTFFNAIAFNSDIGSWDTSLATRMDSMFNNAESFNQDIGGWDTGNVTHMSYFIRNADSFNQDLDCWDVNNIPSEPSYFANTSFPATYKPNWGTSGGGMCFMF